MILGSLEAVRRYPIKSMRGEALEFADVTAGGIPGDRAAALLIRAGHARAGKTYRGKEDERLHLLGDAGAALARARSRGVDLAIAHGEHFFDDAPVSLLVDRWLDELCDAVGYRVQWERFRPNFLVEAAPGFGLQESELVGSLLHLGAVGLRVRSPIERCVAVTYHPQGDASDPRVLRYIAQQRNGWMGIYCDVVRAGTVRVGDPLIKEAPLNGASTPHTR